MISHARQTLLNKSYWSAEKNRFAFALDQQNQQVDEPSVLATVPMWFGLLDDEKAGATIAQLAGPEHQNDWGMRSFPRRRRSTARAAITSVRCGRCSRAGRRLGSIATIARCPDSPISWRTRSWRSMVRWGTSQKFCRATYYQPIATSSPHQIWSAAMVISPLLRWSFGLKTEAAPCHLTLAPHVPAGWSEFRLNNLHVGSASLGVVYHKTASEIALEVTRAGSGECSMEFSPAVSLRAQISAVELNGKRVPFKLNQ